MPDQRVPVDFLLFAGMDLMDFSGPWEVLLTANRLAERAGRPQPFDPVAFSPHGAAVVTYGGLEVAPTGAPRSHGVLLVPGVIDVDRAVTDEQLTACLTRVAADKELVASVCTGAFLLDATGLLPGRWTTHWEDRAALNRPGGVAARVVDAGRVVTGGGIACGLDVGLHLVTRLAGEALAVAVARQMDYAWQPAAEPGRP